ncbi:tetratricopeptide repeat protein [Phenylobacterium sp. VNQ135]|uniref:tetratricopeptide repeat protein n=1 Tax=Phenylobacterium sp. VNQ135 TaxID=3400922 RepID=UPI003C0B2CCB
MRLRLLAFAAPMVLLAACATTSEGPADPGVATAAADTAYGMFLAGNAALAEGRSDEAARFLDMARAQSGDESTVAERAFTAALLAGEISKAAQLAPDGPAASEPGKRMGRLTKAVESIATGKGKIAQEQLAGDAIGFPHRSAAALLAPWAAAQAGDVEASLVRPQVRGDPTVDYFGQLGQAFLYERARRYDEAETDFKAITGSESPSELTVLAYGGFLERRGRRADAIKLYDAGLGRSPSSVGLKAARARAAAGKSAPAAPSVKEGAALAMLAPAATMIAAKQGQIGLAYLRLALRLDPQRNDAWLMVGDFLQGAGDVSGARAAYARPKPGSPEYGAAQAKLAWSYQQEGDKATAVKLARAAAATGDADARLTLSDLLRANEDYEESVRLLGELIGEARTPDWRLYYARGAALSQMGRWSEAEADLEAALKLRPDEPELLNFLGYTWIDRGERLKEAMAMVEKAVASNPRSGAMIDSLGWAHYRLGDYKAAVEKLEQAVELEAGDPEINNHLGDAYWMVGRKDEAVFQWRRVLTLKPDAKIKADAERKLASGQGPLAPKLATQ